MPSESHASIIESHFPTELVAKHSLSGGNESNFPGPVRHAIGSWGLVVDLNLRTEISMSRLRVPERGFVEYECAVESYTPGRTALRAAFMRMPKLQTRREIQH